MTGSEANAPDLQALAQAYLDAFEARNLDACLAMFIESSSIDFQDTLYKGLEAVKTWHEDRFAANLRLLKVESVNVKGDVVTVDCTAASNRLAAWNVKSLPGRITMRFEGDKIKEGKLSARMMNVFDFLRSGE